MMVMGKNRIQKSYCKHLNRIGDYSQEDISIKRGVGKCEAPECYSSGGNLWVCLHKKCLFVACAGNEFNHVLTHFQENKEHCIILDLISLRVFCYSCENEVFLENNDPPLPGTAPSQPMKPIKTKNVTIAEPDSDSEDENVHSRPRGLSGLRNLGNTCYINAALQALSNCPPLTQFFLDCGHTIRFLNQDGISKSYLRLMHNIWHKRRPSFISPDSLVSNFKESSSAHWIFGNYNQQDSQEFLRYFMDALHEDLKEPIYELIPGNYSNDLNAFGSCDSDNDSSSEMEYESCESGNCSGNQSESEDNDVDKQNRMGQESMETTQLIDDNRSMPLEPDAKEHKNILNRKQVLVQQMNAENSLTSGRTQATSSDMYVSRETSTEATNTAPQGFCSSGNHHLIKREIPFLRRKLVKMNSVISDIFDGKIISSVQCLTCDKVSSTRETFQDLSLPIPTRDQLIALHSQVNTGYQINSLAMCNDASQNQGWISWGWSWLRSWLWGPAITLHDCLAAFFSADELKGDNMYSCEKCKKLRNGIKYSRVVNLPEVLCIHLKRFRNDLTKTAKVNSSVSFPLENLDLSPYVHKDSKDQVTTYDLNAVICHYGSDSGCGHYTSYAMNYINGGWYEFDDQYVTEVMPEVVLNCEAYVLFYRKTSEEMNRRRSRVIELMKRSHKEPGLMRFFISKQWVNKFNTFAEPGPITNSDFLCPHGGVHPIKASSVEDMCTVMSQSIWEYLHDVFGGGPVCNHLFVCPTCLAEKNYLERRQKIELDTFIKLHQEFQAVDQPTVIYAVSMSWFREWQNFVKAKDAMTQPPGPIDNMKVILQKGNQQTLKSGSDYGQMSEAMWNFLFEIYGGGPQIIIRPSLSPTSIVVTHTQKIARKSSESEDYRVEEDAGSSDE